MDPSRSGRAGRMRARVGLAMGRSRPSPAARARNARRRRRPEPAVPSELRRLRIALGTFALVVLVGFFGYRLLTGVGWLDSLYMTVITITTVGFREVIELDQAAKTLTIGLIVAGVGSVSYAAVTAAEFVVEGHLRRYIERRRMHRDIDQIGGHVIVCGFGRVGRHLADALADDGHNFVVIDDNDDKLDVLQRLDYLHVRGDATAELVLEEAAIDRARAVVACVHSDADNVLITLTAKGLNPDATVVARSKADETEGKLRRAGADRVIAPATVGGRRIAQLLTRPAVADFLDGIGAGGTDYTLEEVPITKGSPLNGRTLRDAGVRERYHVSVLAIRQHAANGLVAHPSAETVFEPGDVLVVVGNESDVAAMRKQCTDG